MKLINSHIAILFFSRSPWEEANQKKWLPHKSQANLQVARCLSKQISEVLEKTRLAVFHFHEGNQIGHTFGERLANAIEGVFHKGYEGVIAVGNDSPELGKTHFDDAVYSLAQGQCVLGPSLRGGTYLIGLTKASFSKEPFQNLPWQGSGLFKSLKHHLQAGNHEVLQLKKMRDINSFHDILAIFKDASFPLKLVRFLRFLVSKPYRIDYRQTPIHSKPFLCQSALRAPPILN